MFFQIYQKIKSWEETPVNTNIAIEYPDKLVFPMITLCNTNQLKLDYLNKKQYLKNLNRISNVHKQKLYELLIANYGNEYQQKVKENTTAYEELLDKADAELANYTNSRDFYLNMGSNLFDMLI